MRTSTDRRVVVAVAIIGLLPALARAQSAQPDLTSLSIEQLLDAELTSTASKFEQEVTRAPASVTLR